MKETITDEKIKEMLTEEEGSEYQRLKNIKKLAKTLGKKVPEDVKENLEKYEKKIEGKNETTNLSDETEKWLKENRKDVMKIMNGYICHMKVKRSELYQLKLDLERRGNNGFDTNIINERIAEVSHELNDIIDQYTKTKSEIEKKLKKYYGTDIYLTGGQFFIETRDEKLEREKKEKEMEQASIKLKDFREAWKGNIDGVGGEVKEKIIEATEKIKVKVELDSDGSRLINFKLGNKSYKILNPILDNHIGSGHEYHYSANSIEPIEKTYISLSGLYSDNEFMRDSEISNYIKQKQGEGLHMPKIEEIKELLHELGKTAGIVNESDQIAMFMYLTGMNGYYWLDVGDDKTSANRESRSRIACFKDFHSFNCIAFNASDFHKYYGSLCMISCN